MTDYNIERAELEIRLCELGLKMDRLVLGAWHIMRSAEDVAYEFGISKSTVIDVIKDQKRIRDGRFL